VRGGLSVYSKLGTNQAGAAMRMRAHDNIWIILNGHAYPGEFLKYLPNHCVKTCSGKFGIQTWPRLMVKPRTIKKEAAA